MSESGVFASALTSVVDARQAHISTQTPRDDSEGREVAESGFCSSASTPLSWGSSPLSVSDRQMRSSRGMGYRVAAAAAAGDARKDRKKGEKRAATGNTNVGKEEWQWDFSGQRWRVKEQEADELARCRAMLMALNNANATNEVTRITVALPEVNAAVKKNGLVLTEMTTELDGVEDIPTDSASFAWERVKAFAIGSELAEQFRMSQRKHERSMRQWFIRPDGTGALPDNESDIVCQLLGYAEEQVDQIVSRSCAEPVFPDDLEVV